MITRSLFVLCVALIGVMLHAAEETPVPFSPVVLTLDESAPHPKVRVTAIDAEAGTFLFQWLDSAGQPVDTGNSVARFTPLAAPAEGAPRPFPSTEILAAAVQAAAA